MPEDRAIQLQSDLPTDTELQSLLQGLKKGSCRQTLVRNLLICKLHREGILPPANIAEITSTSTSTVKRVVADPKYTLGLKQKFLLSHQIDSFIVRYM